MAQVRSIDLAGKSFHQTGRFRLLGWSSVLALASLMHAQAAPAPARSSARKDGPAVSAAQPSTPAPAVVPAAVDPVPAPEPPPAPQSADQKPPQPPVVTWEGNQLTIDAENSTLAAILLAVKTRTGASMEIPAAASAQRVFVHFGPGPVRDVLSSLLYGTGFDYIVETAEDNPDVLRSVVLTAGGNGDDSAAMAAPGTAVAANGLQGAAAQAAAHREAGMRLMPGWAGPGKPAFQADAEAALAAEAARQESGPASDGADATAQNPPAAGTESASAGQEANSNSSPSSSPAAPSSTSAGSSTEAGLPPTPAAQADAAAAPAPASDSDDQNGLSHQIQSMTHMFEQRRQIQAQQNQATQQPQPSAN